jgi:hypothetical protein
LSTKASKKTPAEVGRELFEKEEAAEREIAKKFDPKKILAAAQKIITVQDPVLGEVKFGGLSIADAFEINRTENEDEKGLKVVYFMLQKAYPDFTWEEIKAFPFEKANRLIGIVGKQASFLRSPKNK